MVIIDRPLNGGTQTVYKFENCYGASVIRGKKPLLWSVAR